VLARSNRLAVAVAGMLALFPAAAAEPPWPSKDAIDRVLQSRPFPDARAIERAPIARPPRIELRVPGMDVEALARQHTEANRVSAMQTQPSSLRIFVTLDMPTGSLRTLAEQAARSGAVLVLRGLKDQSMRATLAKVQALTGEHSVSWQIDPEAFKRFAVERAPTFVLMTGSGQTAAEPACTSECPTGTGFVAVAGDVTIDYALSAMVRQVPSAKAHAQPFLTRLKESP